MRVPRRGIVRYGTPIPVPLMGSVLLQSLTQISASGTQSRFAIASLQAITALGADAGGATLPGDLTVTGTTSTQGNTTISGSGQTISDVKFTGWVEITGNGNTLQNCRVEVGGGANEGVKIGPGVSGTLLDGVEIGGGSNGITNTGVAIGLLFGDVGSGAVTNVANNVWIHNTIDGIRADGRCRFQWSRVGRHLNANQGMDVSGYRDDGNGTHGDGSQSTGWGNIEFLHSEIESGNNDAIFLNQEGGNPAIGTVIIDYCRVHGHTGGPQVPNGTNWSSSYGIRITAGGPCHVTNTDIDGSFDGHSSGAFGTFSTWTNNRRNGSPVGAP